MLPVVMSAATVDSVVCSEVGVSDVVVPTAKIAFFIDDENIGSRIRLMIPIC